MSTTWIIIIIVALFLILLISMYNGLVGKRNQVQNAFAGIDAYLKKRYDLIPNLVSAVQQYMQHEKGVLSEITLLRTNAMKDNISADEKIELNNKISQSLKSINVAVENYPDLKANTNFLQLQSSLNEVEEQLSAARRSYNASVKSYNNSVQMFPSNILASISGYKAKEFFETSETERENINIKKLFNQ